MYIILLIVTSNWPLSITYIRSHKVAILHFITPTQRKGRYAYYECSFITLIFYAKLQTSILIKILSPSLKEFSFRFLHDLLISMANRIIS